MQDRERLQKNMLPPLWIIGREQGRTRLRRREGVLRADIGVTSVFDPRLPSIKIDEIVEVQIVADYAPPTPRLGMILAGAAVAFVLAGGNEFMTNLMLAITTTCFACVAMMVGRSTPARQRIALLTMTDTTRRTITYRIEDESQIKTALGSASWPDMPAEGSMTRPTGAERRGIEQIRIGMVLTASALSLVALYLISDQHPGGYALRIPYEIVRQTTWGIVIIVYIMAVYQMIRVKVDERRHRQDDPKE